MSSSTNQNAGFVIVQKLPFVILLCLMPDDFSCQGRAFGSERVNIIIINKVCCVGRVEIQIEIKKGTAITDIV